MFCPQCGAPNDEDSIFCGNCGAVLQPDEIPAETEEELQELSDTGTPEAESVEKMLDVTPSKQSVPPPPPRPAAPPPRAPASVPTSGLAIASLLLGIGGLTILPFFGSLLALLFGYMARADIRRRRGEVTGEGLALGGIVLGWVSVGIAVLGILAVGGMTVCGLCGAFGTGSW
ncbi:MAG: DUF4190 domain-containing protein [Anaerolineae bacterium]|nr:DUF4190 domain-containing protein [Anaerolineae bacterium]